jgi:serine/threonine-protein kinase
MTGTLGAPSLAKTQFKRVRAIGQGAGSVIYLVTEESSGKSFALKVINRESADEDIYVRQATHEFAVARMLSHPNILKIHDCRTTRKWFKTTGVELLMEYVDGRVLDDLRDPPLSQLVLIFCKVADGLAHMHRRGVYHGDVKPGNIMLSLSGAVKIIDFGTAWIKGQDKGRVQGTPHYMAPEQGRQKIVDERTDLYNFGATMYRLVTGEYANLGIPGLDDGRTGRSRLQTPMSLNDQVPGTLSECIMRCLAANPDKRPAGVFEVKNQLEAVARYLGVEGKDPAGSEEGRR